MLHFSPRSRLEERAYARSHRVVGWWVNSHSTGKATAERGEIAEKPNLCGLCELRGCIKLTHYGQSTTRDLGSDCGIEARMTTSNHRWNVVGRSIAVASLACAVVPLAGAHQRGNTTPSPQNDRNRQEWIQLFNGRDLDGWTIKFAKHNLGDNFNDTVRVENGLMEVRSDKWQGFNNEFGHIFYKEPFSYYRLAAEYRFVGEQVPGGPAWAIRNNGLMLHCQKPSTMLKDQDFPISIEVQLLGGLGNGRPRTTASLCTPGSNVVMNGQLHTPHCTNSTSMTYDGDQWVRVEAEVHGDELVRHIVDGRTVLEYTKPQVGGGAVSPVDPALKVDGTPMTSGYIAIEAETAPTDFRKIELLNLEGCMDPKASNYKKYYVKANPQMCLY